MTVGDNAELFSLSCKRRPYVGKLLVIEEGAVQDLIWVDSDLLSNIKSIEDPEKNLLPTIRDRTITKRPFEMNSSRSQYPRNGDRCKEIERNYLILLGKTQCNHALATKFTNKV
jgi:hypothetical protein